MKYIIVMLLIYCIAAVSCKTNEKQFVTTFSIEDSGVTNGQMDTAVLVLKKRMEGEKLKYAMVTANYKDYQVTIQSGILEKDWIKNCLVKPGALMFYECYSFYELINSLKAADKLVASKINQGKTDSVINPLFKVFNIVAPYQNKSGEEAVMPYIGAVVSEQLPLFKKYIQLSKDALPADATILFKEELAAKSSQRYYTVYFVKENDYKFFASNHIKEASAELDSKRPGFQIKFDEYGQNIFARMTTKNVNRSIAVVLDGNILVAPKVISRIDGGNMAINGEFEKREIIDAVNILRSGFLPLHLTLKNIEAVKKAE